MAERMRKLSDGLKNHLSHLYLQTCRIWTGLNYYLQRGGAWEDKSPCTQHKLFLKGNLENSNLRRTCVKRAKTLFLSYALGPQRRLNKEERAMSHEDNKSRAPSKRLSPHPPHPVPSFWQKLTHFGMCSSLALQSLSRGFTWAPTHLQPLKTPKCLCVGVLLL